MILLFCVPVLCAQQLQVSPDFGKTHFIAGTNSDQIQPVVSETITKSQPVPPTISVFFSPDDDVNKALLDLINKETKSIKIAVFVFTDPQIADAVMAAQQRGVQIEVIIDPSHLKDRYSKIALLQKQKIVVFEYNPDYIKDKRSNLMHHKFAVFGCEDLNSACVWTGSFNFTQAAGKRNQENALIIADARTVKQYLDQFEKMKKRCVKCR
jgi:phosphatidylserine/phosphatidylglycerophosphate/cardiolipin synthase-like enzyme